MYTLKICILVAMVAHSCAFTKEARTGALHIPEKILGGVIDIVQSHKAKPMGYQQYGQANQLQGQFQLLGQGQYASGYQHGYNQASLANNQANGQTYPQAQGFSQGPTGQYQNGLNTQSQANGQYQLGGVGAWNQNNKYQGNQVPQLQSNQGQSQYVANQGASFQAGLTAQNGQIQYQNGQFGQNGQQNQNGQFSQNQNGGQFVQNQNGQFAQNGQFTQNQNSLFSQNQNGQYVQNQYQNGYGQNYQTSGQFQGQYGQPLGSGQAPACVCTTWTKPQADEMSDPVKMKQELNIME